MTNLLSITRNTVLTLSMLIGVTAFAEAPKNDAQTVEEMSNYAEQSSKMREDHIKEMRDVHVKHINEMYEKKLANNAEMTLLWKQVKPGDKKANKELKNQIKEKKKSFHKELKQFREDFKDNVLKKKNKEFQEIMKTRNKEKKDMFID